MPRNVPRSDPRKLQLLVRALSEGIPKTYEDLVAWPLLELKRRSLQTYLDVHLPAEGHKILRGTTPGPQPQATFAISVPQASGWVVNLAAKELARGVLKGLFPLDGTELDHRPGQALHVLAFASGVAAYQEKHMKAAFNWITAAENDPPLAVVLRYSAARDATLRPRDEEPRERLVWPLGVLLREGRRLYLAGLVEPAGGLADTRNFALERVIPGSRDPGVRLAGIEQQVVTAWLRDHRPRPQDLVNAPFGLIRPDVSRQTVRLHVRFSPAQAAFVRGRRWHAQQKEIPREDGGIELRLGKVDLREALAWCCQWIDGLTVLGDTILRNAYLQLLRDRFEAQAAVTTGRTPARTGNALPG